MFRKLINFPKEFYMAIKFMLSDLFGNSDDFKNHSYGFFTNQLGHMALGAFLFFCVWRILPNPSDLKALSVIFCGYTTFEIIKHGWKNWDTILDISFVMAGAGVSVFYDIEYVFSNWQSLGALFSAFAFLFTATWWIYYKDRRGGNDF